jgi:hypothetical protein
MVPEARIELARTQGPEDLSMGPAEKLLSELEYEIIHKLKDLTDREKKGGDHFDSYDADFFLCCAVI